MHAKLRIWRSRARSVALTAAILVSAIAPYTSGPTPAVSAAGTTGTIVHSADGVNLRAEPSYGAEVLTTMAEGTLVDVQTHAAEAVLDADGHTSWWPVAHAGVEGWVAGYYLDVAGQAGAATTADLAVADAGGIVTDDASVPTGDAFETFDLGSHQLDSAAALINEPDGVHLRDQPGTVGASLRTLSHETRVALRVHELDTVYVEGTRWWPVQVDDLQGWVAGDFLKPAQTWQEPIPAAAEPAWSDAADVALAQDMVSGFSIGSYVAVATGEGSGLNIRADAAPDAERIGILPEHEVVQVMDGPRHDPTGSLWYLVTDGSVTGFVSGQYLAYADQPGVPDAASLAAEIRSKVAAPGVATGSLNYPVESRLWTFTQAFGCSPYPWFYAYNASWGCHFHNGIDLAAPAGTPLLAADGGTVVYAGWCDCGLGYYVKLDHGNGMTTIYGHMAEQPWVTSGQAVSKGDILGPMGSTGLSTGPHIHFVVTVDGVDQDPLLYLPV